MASHGEKGNQRLRRITSVQPGALSYEELVKEGTFGRIYAGKLGESCEALVKTVIDGASLTQVACLMAREARHMEWYYPGSERRGLKVGSIQKRAKKKGAFMKAAKLSQAKLAAP